MMRLIKRLLRAITRRKGYAEGGLIIHRQYRLDDNGRFIPVDPKPERILTAADVELFVREIKGRNEGNDQ